MLERFRSSKPTSTSLTKSFDEKESNSEIDETEDEASSINDNETDIANLKNRLNILRQKLFQNFDTRDDDSGDYSTKLIESQFKERPPIQPKNVKSVSKQPVLLETNKFNSSNKTPKQSSINIESIDLKAKHLIEKR